MPTSRRNFLIAGVGIVGSEIILRAQSSEPYSLGFDDVPITAGQSITISVTASAPADITVHIESRDGQKLSTPTISIREPGQVSSPKSPTELPAPGARVNIDVKPLVKSSPSVAVAFGQNMNVKELEMFTRKVPFKADPAKRPTPGAFTINLTLESMVETRIWRGTRTNGAPLVSKTDNHHYPPEDRIPWDLKSSGKLVTPGKYIALLTCTPILRQPANVKTVVYSCFTVE
jgi:hypothetical protein